MKYVEYTVRGATYGVDVDVLDCLVAAFDVWRDGLGKFAGALGRAAFLRGTSDVVHRSVRITSGDPWIVERYLRVLRHVLASRPRSAKSSSISVIVVPP